MEIIIYLIPFSSFFSFVGLILAKFIEKWQVYSKGHDTNRMGGQCEAGWGWGRKRDRKEINAQALGEGWGHVTQVTQLLPAPGGKQALFCIPTPLTRAAFGSAWKTTLSNA